MVLDKLESDLR